MYGWGLFQRHASIAILEFPLSQWLEHNGRFGENIVIGSEGGTRRR